MDNVRVFRPNFLVARIGELALQLGAFAKMLELGWLEPTAGIVLAPEGQVCNEYLLHYFTPWIRIERQDTLDHIPSIDGTRFTLPNGRTYSHDRANVAIGKAWEDSGRPPLLSLDEKHCKAGEGVLTMLGMPESAWFAVLHIRESGFLNDPHNNYRNADIETYLEAAQAITESGGWVVRLGDPSMTPLPAMDGVIDYAHHELRCDWMDIYLMAAARFFLGTTSGPWVVASLFGVPIAQTNNTPFSERPFSGRDLYISKLYLRDGEPLPFSEAMAPPFRHNYTYTGPLRDNSIEEITELAMEMMQRLDGKTHDTDEDVDLQERTRRLSDFFEDYGTASHMGRDFLRRHKYLLP
ncbi:MAG: TIGR04372 family glycosyltransferase [Nitrospinota bacterium]|jgi:putative glycosyltransferase (TIGR04372 family)|nr:TIGR04372 family glycosyltransferase [Nitrospinota bacterium]HIJ93109.1 TIGR04372 family glycosyltransferase [Rhodospirillaceae bacterium]